MKPSSQHTLSFYMMRLILCLSVLVLSVWLFLYVLLGSQIGSKFILEQLSAKAGVDLTYSDGNLRDGIWVDNLVIAEDSDMAISVSRGFVQMGYRALLYRQVHIIKADVETITITNKNPPSDEPYDYKRLSLPVDLVLENVHAQALIYNQATKEPINFGGIAVDKLSWIDAKIDITNGNLLINDNIDIKNITGSITAEGDYPLFATAQVHIKDLDTHYFAPFDIKAQGTLKRSYGTVKSQYNNANVSGEFVVQSMDEGSPFWVNLAFDELLVPYVDSQQIHLNNGKIQAIGVVSDIDLRINTNLHAQDIPSGHYQGRAKIHPDGMVIEKLQATTANGVLTADGNMSWQGDFVINASVYGENYHIQNAIAEHYQDYADYAPKYLNGQIDFAYNNNRYELALIQKNGEHINAVITTDDVSDNINIHATWDNLIRHNLPNMGIVNSPHGQADITINNDKLTLKAAANIQKLHSLPQGDYDINLDKIGDDIKINVANYKGVLGDLTADGQIDLANDHRPLSYRLNVATTQFIPNAYFEDKTPIEFVRGKTVIAGRLTQKNGDEVHDISLHNSDLTAHLTNADTAQQMTLTGESAASLRFGEEGLAYFTFNHKGRLLTHGINEALADNALMVDLFGNGKIIDIHQLSINGQAGSLEGKGRVDLSDGVAFDADVSVKDFYSAYFYDKSAAILTGDLIAQGSYKEGAFGYTTAQFTGLVEGDDIPAGDVSLNLAVSGEKYTINQLYYKGGAGLLQASGYVDIKQGIVADINGMMEDFDIGIFAKNHQSQLSGNVNAFINWQKSHQDINISDLDVSGTLNGELVYLSGLLQANLDLPDNPKAYFASLQKSPFRLNKPPKSNFVDMGQLQNTLTQQNNNLRQIIKKINADDFKITIGNNNVHINGHENNLMAAINVENLGQILPTIQGKIVGGLIIKNEDTNLPTIYADLHLSAITMPSFALREGSVVAKIVNLGNDNSSVVVQAVGVNAFGQSLMQARFDFDGTQNHHKAAVFVNDGKLQARARIQGGFYEGQYVGVVAGGHIETAFGVLSQSKPSEIRYGANTLMMAPHCWQGNTKNHKTGDICLNKTLALSKTSGLVDMTLNHFDMAIVSPFIPKDISLQAAVNGNIQAQWQKDQNPTINVALASSNGSIGVVQQGVGVSSMDYEYLSLKANSSADGLNVRGNITAGGEGVFDVIIDPYKDNRPIKGTMAVHNINLAMLKPFLPALQSLDGEINISGDLSGTLSAPQLHGNAVLTNGHISIKDIPMSLQNMNLTAKINGNNADLVGDFRSGEGVGQIQGKVDWAKPLELLLSVQGEDLSVSNPPLLSAKINPHLELIIRPDAKYVNVQGVISVPQATIRPPEASDDFVKLSNDVMVIDRRMSADIESILQVVEPWSINADIGLDLGDEVIFRGFGTKLPLAGALHLTQNGRGTMQAHGVIQVSERSKIDAIGQNLDLNYAQIRFNGDVKNPRLSIEAVRELEGDTVGVRVTGLMENPNIAVFNTAGLSEQQAMNALVTGKLSEQGNTQISDQAFRSQVTNSLVVAGLSLGLTGTNNLTNQIGQALGFEGLTLDASGNASDANVNVTAYISPDLYIRYGVGVFNAQSSLSMRYQLTRRVYIEATSATKRFVDVVYRWQF